MVSLMPILHLDFGQRQWMQSFLLQKYMKNQFRVRHGWAADGQINCTEVSHETGVQVALGRANGGMAPALSFLPLPSDKPEPMQL